MNVYQGKSVFGGIAIGHLCVYKKGEQQDAVRLLLFSGSEVSAKERLDTLGDSGE